MPRREVQLSEKPRPPVLRPLEPGIVALVREHGWEVLPREWARQRLREIAQLRRQLDDARTAAILRDSSPVSESHTPREPVD